MRVKMKYVLLLLLSFVLLVGCSVKSIDTAVPHTEQLISSDNVPVSQFLVELNNNVMSPNKLDVSQNSIIILDVFDHDNRTDVFLIEGYDEKRLVNGHASFYFKAVNKGTFKYGLLKEQNKGLLIIK